MTRPTAVIGVEQPDGRILAARVASRGGVALARRLAASYGDRVKSTMLVSLGAIASVGATPAACVIPDDAGDPDLVTPEGFEAMRSDATHFHLFDRGGSWIHWEDRRVPMLTLAIEED